MTLAVAVSSISTTRFPSRKVEVEILPPDHTLNVDVHRPRRGGPGRRDRSRLVDRVESPRGAEMARIIDLTLTLRPEMRGVEFEPLHTVAEHGWNSRTLHLYSHSGTHMDAPHHFAAGDGTIDRIPLDHCLLPAWVADVTGVGPKALITVASLGSVAHKVRPGDGLLLKTGWSEHADRPQYYRDNLPRISRELADWCVERRVQLIGVEPPSVADVNNLEEVTAIHRILLGGGIVIVEGLTNLTALRQERVFFGALPLKIEGGDGSPCRAFALEGT
jgi:arylformamidase